MTGTTNAINTYLNFNLGVNPIYLHKDGKTFIQVYYHNISAGYWSKSSTSTFQYSTTENKFSLMGKLDQLTYYPGIYHFLLEYPSYSATKYNEWTQTTNPMLYTSTVSNYTPIHIDFPGTDTTTNSFNGFAIWPSHSSCYMKSYNNGGSTNWWFACFSYAVYEGGIPGPAGGSAGSGAVVNQVRLWLRCK